MLFFVGPRHRREPSAAREREREQSPVSVGVSRRTETFWKFGCCIVLSARADVLSVRRNSPQHIGDALQLVIRERFDAALSPVFKPHVVYAGSVADLPSVKEGKPFGQPLRG